MLAAPVWADNPGGNSQGGTGNPGPIGPGGANSNYNRPVRPIRDQNPGVENFNSENLKAGGSAPDGRPKQARPAQPAKEGSGADRANNKDEKENKNRYKLNIPEVDAGGQVKGGAQQPAREMISTEDRKTYGDDGAVTTGGGGYDSAVNRSAGGAEPGYARAPGGGFQGQVFGDLKDTRPAAPAIDTVMTMQKLRLNAANLSAEERTALIAAAKQENDKHMAVFRKANKDLKEKNYQQVIDTVNEAIAVDPQNIALRRVKTMAENRALRFTDAERSAMEALGISPYDAPILEELAWAQLNSGRATEALENATRAIGLNPQSARAYVIRAFANQQVGRMEAMRADLDRAAAISPDRYGRHPKAAAAGVRLFDPAAQDGWELIEGPGGLAEYGKSDPRKWGMGALAAALVAFGLFGFPKKKSPPRPVVAGPESLPPQQPKKSLGGLRTVRPGRSRPPRGFTKPPTPA